MNEEQKALLRKGVEWVEEQDALPIVDRTWHQGSWWMSKRRREGYLREIARKGTCHVSEQQVKDCGTAYCLFGYLADITGQEWDEDSAGFLGSRLKSGKSVSTYIARLLDLDAEEAEELSRAHNTAADIREVAEQIAGERL